MNVAGPDFIVIGAMKCATSTVCAYLEDHPEVGMVAGCEPNYFSHDDNHARGREWYASFFEGLQGRLLGEGSNDYSAGALYPRSAERMAAEFPGLKLIYMVRDPLERIASAWVQNRVDHGIKAAPTLDRAVLEEPDRYLDRSLYWKNLSLYRRHFPDDRIFVGFMEDLKADPAGFFAGLTEFLGVSPHVQVRREKVNVSRGKPVPTAGYAVVKRLPLVRSLKRRLPQGLRSRIKERFFSRPLDQLPEFSPKVRAMLVEQLREDSRQLLRHMGRPEDFWGS